MPRRPSLSHLAKRGLAWLRSPAAIGYVLAGGAIVVVVLLLGREAERHIHTFESTIAGLGPWGGLAFAALLVVGTSLLVPESIFGVAAGLLFGLKWGFLTAYAGNIVAAGLQFALSHRLFRSKVQRTLASRPWLHAIQHAVLKNELRLQVLLRLTPVNPATMSYILGAAGVRFRGFVLASLAVAPHVLLECFFGDASRHLTRVAIGHRTATLHDLVLLAGLVSMVVAVVLISRSAHKALREIVAAADDPGTAG